MIIQNLNIFQMRPGATRLPEGVPENGDLNSLRNRAFSPGPYLNMREVTGRHTLEAGNYAIIVSTYEINEEGGFFLRVFSDIETDG